MPMSEVNFSARATFTMLEIKTDTRNAPVEMRAIKMMYFLIHSKTSSLLLHRHCIFLITSMWCSWVAFFD